MSEPELFFLRSVAQDLAALLVETERRGHTLLATMIGLAQAEAEDRLRTDAHLRDRYSTFQAGGSKGTH